MNRIPRYSLAVATFLAALGIFGVQAQRGVQTLAAAGGSSFVATFDGDPTSPQPFRPADWAVTVHQQNYHYWFDLEDLQADHGPACEPAPATHAVTAYGDTPFICHNHVMTAVTGGESGYGLISLTPPALADFSQGEVVIRWDMSTARTSSREWIDVRVERFDQNTQLSEDNREAINEVEAKLINPPGSSLFDGEIIRDGVRSSLPFSSCCVSIENALAAAGLSPSPVRRDTFEIHLSRTHYKVGMPAYNLWWVDTDIPDLGWDRGVVTIDQRAYNPAKDCGFNGTCGPNTWHWDNLSITPASPFTILAADRDFVAAGTTDTMAFAGPAPAGSFLRFMGSDGVEVSTDDGTTWAPAQLQGAHVGSGEHLQQYWTPIPAGTQRVRFRGQPTWCCPFVAKNATIWSLTPPSASSSAAASAAAATAGPTTDPAMSGMPMGGVSTPSTPTPTVTLVGPATPNDTPTSTPTTSTPTSTPVAMATNTPTAVATATFATGAQTGLAPASPTATATTSPKTASTPTATRTNSGNKPGNSAEHSHKH